MRLWLALVPLTFVWALAPIFGSPASLWVMPLVAVLAASLTDSPRRAVVLTLGSLALLLLAWLAFSATEGDLAHLGQQAGAAAAIGAFHAPVAAALAAGAGWVARRARARWG